jgi:hypothetical protein
MKKVMASLVMFLLVFFLFSVKGVLAKVITNEKGTVNVAKGEILNDDLFAGGQTVEIAGTVNGDVFIGAQTVKVTGIINGNLHVGANTLDISGTVKGNVYAGAQNVLLSSAKIGGSVIVGAATLNADKDSIIGGSLIAGAGNVTIDSQVKRSAYAGAGSLTLGSNARIGKDFYYSSGNNQANISSSAKIAGLTYKSEPKNIKTSVNVDLAKKQIPAVLGGIRFGASIISFLGALIVGFIYLKLFGKHFVQTADIVSKSFWKSLGIGFLVSIAAVPGLIILLITVVGIPLAGLALLMLLLYIYLAKIVVGSALGTWISKRFSWKTSAYGAFALGLFAFYVVKMIPFVGGLAGLAVLWSGLGALTLRMFSKTS